MFIFEEVHENMSIKMFDILPEYMAPLDCIDLTGVLNYRFLLSVDHSALSKKEYCKKHVLGSVTFYSRITKV